MAEAEVLHAGVMADKVAVAQAEQDVMTAEMQQQTPEVVEAALVVAVGVDAPEQVVPELLLLELTIKFIIFLCFGFWQGMHPAFL